MKATLVTSKPLKEGHFETFTMDVVYRLSPVNLALTQLIIWGENNLVFSDRFRDQSTFYIFGGVGTLYLYEEDKDEIIHDVLIHEMAVIKGSVLMNLSIITD